MQTVRPGFLYLGAELQLSWPRFQQLPHRQGPSGLVALLCLSWLVMGVSLPFQPYSSGEQRLFSIHGPSEETLCMLAPLYSPGCEDRYEEAAGQCPEGFVFPWSGLPQGEPLVPLHIGPGRLKGLIFVPSVKWFKLQILSSSKLLPWVTWMAQWLCISPWLRA